MAKDDAATIELARKLLISSEVPRDSLPYSEEFDRMKAEFERRTQQKVNDHYFWKLLSKTAKKGGLSTPGVKKKGTKAKELTRDEQLEILRLMPEGIGSRDDLPYTKRFDELRRRFIELTQSRLSRHEFWRALSSVAKRSRKPKPVFDEAPRGDLPKDMVDLLERMNPWWKAEPGPKTPDLRRWAYYEVLNQFNSEFAKIIAMRGPRQVGKTTIQFQLIERLLTLRQIPPNQILRVQFDEVPALGLLKTPVEAIVRWFEKNVLREGLNEASHKGRKVYFFFDEIQNLANWSEQIKSIVDASDVQVLITGSSALRIGQGKDSLAGRISLIELGPLRLSEIAKLRKISSLAAFSEVNSVSEWVEKDFWLDLIEYADRNQDSLNHAFEFFSSYGGYPVCHSSKDAGAALLAKQIVDDVVDRTISHEKAQGASETVVEHVFRLLARYAGDRVSPQELAKQATQRLGTNVSQSEIRAAISYLENTLLVRLLQPLESGRSKQCAYPTICLCDHFIRYALLREEIPLVPSQLKGKNEQIATQAGHLVEGIIGNFFAGLQGVDAFSYPRKNEQEEVDIVLSIGTKHIPIEVKYRNGSLKRSQIIGVQQFCNKPQYEASFGLVITQEQSGEIFEGIVGVPAKTLLLLV